MFAERDNSIRIAQSRGKADFRLTYGKELISAWEPVIFDIVDGHLMDYQLNNIGWSLCSCRLRSGIEGMLTGREAIQWLPVFIEDPNQGVFNYFILHIYRRDNVLNMDHAIFSGDLLVKPVLDEGKVQELNANVFATPFDSVRIYVRETVRIQLRQNGITGLKFLKSALAK